MSATPGTVAIVSPDDGRSTVQPRPGAFSTVRSLGIDGSVNDTPATHMKAIDLAKAAGAEWMIVLGAGESLRQDAFELTAPALGLYDAIFGSAHVVGSGEAVARLSRLAFDTSERLPHALLNWWIPAAHLVRTDLASRSLERGGSPSSRRSS